MRLTNLIVEKVGLRSDIIEWYFAFLSIANNFDITRYDGNESRSAYNDYFGNSERVFAR